MNRLVRPTLLIALRLGLLLALATWIASQWQVLGATCGSFSCAAGPGGWEICGWEIEEPKPFSLFMYSAADEALNAPALATRQWGVFIYHWLVFAVLACFYTLPVWFFPVAGESSAGE